MKTEEFKPIKESPNYLISNLGNVLSLNYRRSGAQQVLKPSLNKRGYLCSHLANKVLKTHRLVAIAFIPNPENKPQVNHINGIKTDNRVENLEWVTASENTLHAYNSGAIPKQKGRGRIFSKITDNQVLDIRKNVNGLTQLELSKIYNVSEQCINAIINNRRRTNV